MSAHENEHALFVLRKKIEERWFESLPISAILETTFRIDLPEHMEANAKHQLRNELYTKIVDTFYQRVNQPVQLGPRQVKIQFIQVWERQEGTKHFYTIDSHNDAVKYAMMRSVVGEMNARWLASVLANGTIEGKDVPAGTHVSMNFLLSRPLDQFRI